MDNQQQSEFWNGDAGERWVNFSDRLDTMLRPFADLVLEAAHLSPHETVLDIGCGGGALSFLAAQKVKSVLGVDISRPLIALAQSRSQSTSSAIFEHGDASNIILNEKRDIALSRFGVMFFADPVKAFFNIAEQLTPNGRLVFTCWQSPEKNLWAKAPLEAAMPFLKDAPSTTDPYAPGPFAFADPIYLKGVLEAAGWTAIELNDWTGNIRLPGKDAGEAASFMMEMGPLSKLIREQDLDFEKVQQALINKMSRFLMPNGAVEMEASVWIVTANKSP